MNLVEWLIVVAVIGGIVALSVMSCEHSSKQREKCEARGGIYAARGNVCLRAEVAIPLK